MHRGGQRACAASLKGANLALLSKNISPVLTIRFSSQNFQKREMATSHNHFQCFLTFSLPGGFLKMKTWVNVKIMSDVSKQLLCTCEELEILEAKRLIFRWIYFPLLLNLNFSGFSNPAQSSHIVIDATTQTEKYISLTRDFVN